MRKQWVLDLKGKSLLVQLLFDRRSFHSDSAFIFGSHPVQATEVCLESCMGETHMC